MDSDTETNRLRKLLELQQASYEREIVLAVAAELERCVQVVMDFPIWIGNKGKAELAAALSPKRR